MSSVKTAISLEAGLYREAQGLARKMRVSRSRLFAAAMAEFIERRRNQELLEAINTANLEAPTVPERRIQRAMRRHQLRRLQGQW